MAILSNNNISTFPSSMRTQDVYSRFTTENNLVNMVNGIVDTDGYVRSIGSDTDQTIEFVLGGYFFRTTIALIQTALNSTDKIYAFAIVGYNYSSSGTTVVGSDPGDARLVGWSGGAIQTNVEDSGNFIGVNFVSDISDIPEVNGTSIPNTFKVYSLLLAEKTGNSWGVPATSYKKFGTLTTSEVDGIVTNALQDQEQ